ncbi:MAG: hypothetical protein OEZ38_02055 [Gammaproteobacteria bacterium]|nr:hypothetical protein [Gammaproteobacteria bacterium]
MEGISDIRIIGIDEKRPPVIRKEPYIDLFFQLTHKAPVEWCRDFNALMSKYPGAPKIKENDGMFIESWVKTPDEIIALFEKLKTTVTECTREYVERIEKATRESDSSNEALKDESGEQGRLNKIIASLNYDVTDE